MMIRALFLILLTLQYTVPFHTGAVAVPGGGTPTVVQSQSTGSGGPESSLNPSSSITIGNVLVAAIYGGAPGDALSFADDLGNTATVLASAGLATDADGIGIACAPITNGGADTLHFTVNGTLTAVNAIAYEVSNATCTQDVTAVSHNSLASTSCNSTAMTTTTANDFLVAVCGNDATNTATITAGSGWSGGLNAALAGPTRPVVMSEYRIGTSPGSFTATSGTFASEEQATLLVALKP